ncbi:UNVERIFIED_ORG: hypothetical protein J2W38_003116 [Variovorax paradoxus]|nr:hypothetical protein [Variovorax paradoxus]
MQQNRKINIKLNLLSLFQIMKRFCKIILLS